MYVSFFSHVFFLAFTQIWWADSPLALYGPVWAAFGGSPEQLQSANTSLFRSFYPLVNDNYVAQWYLAMPTNASLFSIYKAQQYIVRTEALESFYQLLSATLSPAQALHIREITISWEQALIESSVLKLARVYSFDRANVLAEVAALPAWQGLDLTYNKFTPPQWCAMQRHCLRATESSQSMETALQQLPNNTLLCVWELTDENAR
jgi:hypothetical protein